jgi:hypothetical protein
LSDAVVTTCVQQLVSTGNAGEPGTVRANGILNLPAWGAGMPGKERKVVVSLAPRPPSTLCRAGVNIPGWRAGAAIYGVGVESGIRRCRGVSIRLSKGYRLRATVRWCETRVRLMPNVSAIPGVVMRWPKRHSTTR